MKRPSFSFLLLKFRELLPTNLATQTSQKSHNQTLSGVGFSFSHSSSAFTLVELIVVIVILTILSTIAFISYEGYTSTARDTKRMNDVSILWKGLSTAFTKSSRYPEETSMYLVSSGSSSTGILLGKQSFVGKTLSSYLGTSNGIFSSNGSSTSSTTSSEYVYSLNSKGSKASVFAFLEKPSTSNQSTIIQSGSITKYIFSRGDGTPLLLDSTAYNPVSADTDVSVNANTTAYAGITSTGTLTLYTTPSTLVSNLPAVYSSGYLAIAGSGGSGGSGGGTSVSAYVATNSTTAYTVGNQFTYSWVSITVTSAGVGTSSSTYAWCDTPDIAIWASGYNPQIWAACNVGASTSIGFDTVPDQISGGGNPSASLPTNRVAAVQGNYYQWWRNDNVTSGAWVTGQYNGTFTSPANTTGDTNFYQGDVTFGSWYTPWVYISNPLGWWNTANGGDAQWPCANGYHIPSDDSTVSTDWPKAAQLIIGTSSPSGTQYYAIRSTLKLPLAGFRLWENGQYYGQGSTGYYLSTSPTSSYSYAVNFYSGGGNIANSTCRANSFSLRCIKN